MHTHTSTRSTRTASLLAAVLLSIGGLTACGTQTAPDPAAPAPPGAAEPAAPAGGVMYADSDILLKQKVTDRLAYRADPGCDPAVLGQIIAQDQVRKQLQQSCADRANQLKSWLEEPPMGGGIPRFM